MNDDDESTAHSCMPACIAGFLLLVCGFASIAPMLNANIKPMDSDWKAMLSTLTVGAVAYFISSTRQSAIKTDTIANLKKDPQ